MSQIGIKSHVVILQGKDDDNAVHAALLIQLLGNYYFFDITQDRSAYEEFVGIPNKFKFCMAGIGAKQYSEYYKFVGVLPENLNNDLLPVPNNISLENIPGEVIEMFASKIPDLTFSKPSQQLGGNFSTTNNEKLFTDPCGFVWTSENDYKTFTEEGYFIAPDGNIWASEEEYRKYQTDGARTH